MIARFDHLTIAVRDLEAAVAAHDALLGRPPVWRGAHPRLGTDSALYGLENALLELTAPRPDALESEGLRAHLASAGEGLIALAFGTDDAAACHALLRERGLRAAPPAYDEAEAGGSTRRYAAVELSPRMTRGLPILVVERSDTDALRQAAGIPAPAAHALDHVVVRTADLGAARTLYGQQLGLRLALDTRIGAVGMLFFRVGGVTVEVVEDPSAGERDLFYGAAYRVRALDEAYARMSAAGLALSPARDGKKPGTRVFSLRAPCAGVPTLVLTDAARA